MGIEPTTYSLGSGMESSRLNGLAAKTRIFGPNGANRLGRDCKTKFSPECQTDPRRPDIGINVGERVVSEPGALRSTGVRERSRNTRGVPRSASVVEPSEEYRIVGA
jgi:hypothetical protein